MAKSLTFASSYTFATLFWPVIFTQNARLQYSMLSFPTRICSTAKIKLISAQRNGSMH